MKIKTLNCFEDVHNMLGWSDTMGSVDGEFVPVRYFNANWKTFFTFTEEIRFDGHVQLIAQNEHGQESVILHRTKSKNVRLEQVLKIVKKSKSWKEFLKTRDITWVIREIGI